MPLEIMETLTHHNTWIYVNYCHHFYCSGHILTILQPGLQALIIHIDNIFFKILSILGNIIIWFFLMLPILFTSLNQSIWISFSDNGSNSEPPEMCDVCMHKKERERERERERKRESGIKKYWEWSFIYPERNKWNVNFLQNSTLHIQHTHSSEFSIGQNTSATPLLIWPEATEFK